MPDPAISVDRVWKRFRRGADFDSLHDLLAAWLRPGRRRNPSDAERADFWALRDVSLAVASGEAVGVIGPNGAGKSTLLKLLAGILRAERGAIDIRGRVSSLIELGAGFHGDLTGRENVRLNASILGMSQRELRRKFDAIVEFADIGDALDTPVKRYSSGMQARLGFAVAAHVEPRVLLVDEVLSVGDRVFRGKCMDKMRGFLRQGAAVVFVSHDLGAVNSFCDRVLLLGEGQTRFCGSPADAIGRYYDTCLESLMDRGVDQSALVEIEDACLLDSEGRRLNRAAPGAPVRFEFTAVFHTDIPRPSFGLSIVRIDDHMTIYESSSTRLGLESSPAGVGDRLRVSYEFPLSVPPGTYAIGLHVRDQDAVTYACHDVYAVRVLVDGPVRSGGTLHLQPRFETQPALPTRPATAARPAVRSSAEAGVVEARDMPVAGAPWEAVVGA